jgi:hypothetical protein
VERTYFLDGYIEPIQLQLAIGIRYIHHPIFVSGKDIFYSVQDFIQQKNCQEFEPMALVSQLRSLQLHESVVERLEFEFGGNPYPSSSIDLECVIQDGRSNG